MPAEAQALLATLWVSALSFAGIALVFGRRPGARGEIVLLSFAAGVLLATSFLEIVPEAVERAAGDGRVFTATLGAMIGFFVLERFLHGFHVHEEGAAPHPGEHLHGPHAGHAGASRYLILVGDGLHNFIDGVVIAASFAVSTELGLVTTFAVTVHEVPQELADFGILVAGGFSVRTALLVNFLSGLTAVLGAVCFFAFAPTEHHLGWLLATTAGMFIYIAGSDLIPQLHHHPHGASRWIYGPFLGGVAVIALLGVLVDGH